MNWVKVIAFAGGAVAGSYLVRRYIFKEPRHAQPLKFEHIQNDVVLNKNIKPGVESTINPDSPYASLYNNKKI
jgi:hypothetical protein